jgi:hypothetical protein
LTKGFQRNEPLDKNDKAEPFNEREKCESLYPVVEALHKFEGVVVVDLLEEDEESDFMPYIHFTVLEYQYQLVNELLVYLVRKLDVFFEVRGFVNDDDSTLTPKTFAFHYSIDFFEGYDEHLIHKMSIAIRRFYSIKNKKEQRKYLTSYDKEDKWCFLENAEIDEGILPIVKALNKYEILVTINSCQGRTSPEQNSEHSPITYVDFYVLHQAYDVANDLLVYLKQQFGKKIEVEIQFEPDTYINDDDYVVVTGNVNLRYRIKSVNGFISKLIGDIAEKIEVFGKNIKN